MHDLDFWVLVIERVLGCIFYWLGSTHYAGENRRKFENYNLSQERQEWQRRSEMAKRVSELSRKAEGRWLEQQKRQQLINDVKKKLGG